jgi:subtilisin family serine protease
MEARHEPAPASARTPARARVPDLAALALAALLTFAAAAAVARGAGAIGLSPPPWSSAAVVPGAAAPRTAAPDAEAPAPYVSDQVLVGFHPGVTARQRHAIELDGGGRGERALGPAVKPVGAGRVATQEYLSPFVLHVPAGSVMAVVDRLRTSAAVAYAEPDYLMQADAVSPNDPSFGLQWSANDTGQEVPFQESNEVLGPSSPGTLGDDDGALAAWQVSTGSRSIVIGEVDTGAEYGHPDLAANIWSNPGGIGGCGAGTHGYNVLAKSCDPSDTDSAYGGHGTHVAGIMGAVGNNGVGVAGVNWQTSILPVKWMNSASSGQTSALIEALQWLLAAKQAGVNIRVVNDSATFSGTAFSQALSNEIDTLGANDILFLTASGNSGANNDESSVRRYPCGYDRPTEICVAASNDHDELPSWANYGPKTVQMAAPGASIYSTLRGGKYGYLSGGSMASPQVAGAAALVLSVAPSLSVAELRTDILSNVDLAPALSGRVSTGGALDVCRALPGCERQWPPPPPPSGTFGRTTVGASSESDPANMKGVSRYALPATGSVSKLSVYLQPSGTSGQQSIEGVIYADTGSAPGALLGTTAPLTFKSSNAAGWYDLPFQSPPELRAGNYWIGIISGSTASVATLRYDTVSGALDYNSNTFTSGPSNPFGAATVSSQQLSLYATYGPSSPPSSPPSNISPPSISGVAQTGQTLTAEPGSWSERPTHYTYEWLRCDAGGANCASFGPTSQTYSPKSGDVDSTLRVTVTAYNAEGPSEGVTSPPTAVVSEAPLTFGKTTVGASAQSDPANLKGVSRYSLPAAGTVSKLSLYLQPTGTTGTQSFQGVIYGESGGAPGALLASSATLSFKNTNAPGWYELNFASGVKLAPGSYWIGFLSGTTAGVGAFRYDTVSGALDYNSNIFTAGPSNPFGTPIVIGYQISLYATYAGE